MKGIIFLALSILGLIFFVLPLALCYLITGKIRPKDVRKVCSILFKD